MVLLPDTQQNVWLNIKRSYGQVVKHTPVGPSELVC